MLKQPVAHSIEAKEGDASRESFLIRNRRRDEFDSQDAFELSFFEGADEAPHVKVRLRQRTSFSFAGLRHCLQMNVIHKRRKFGGGEHLLSVVVEPRLPVEADGGGIDCL